MRLISVLLFTVAASGCWDSGARGGQTGSAATGGAGATGGAAGGGCDQRGPSGADFPPAAALSSIAELPDPFTFFCGPRLASAGQWPARRAELVRLSEHYEYGALPPAADSVSGQLAAGTLTVSVSAGGRSASFTAAMTLPSSIRSPPFPAFIRIAAGGSAPDASSFTARGYAVVYLDTSAVAGDSVARSGAFYTLYPDAKTGVLMAWAWGVHRIVDVLATVPEIDASKLAVNGFSRWGKGALLAGAYDERIALTVPSSSGLTGTGQLRFFYEDDGANEKIGNALSYAPYWYTSVFAGFASDAAKLPFDQHEIMALVAPRALLATQGKYDYWTNPRGTSISWRAAKPVWDFLGASGKVGVSWDDVAHQLTQKHVDAMLEFADIQFNGAAPTRDHQALPAEFADEPTAHPWTAP